MSSPPFFFITFLACSFLGCQSSQPLPPSTSFTINGDLKNLLSKNQETVDRTVQIYREMGPKAVIHLDRLRDKVPNNPRSKQQFQRVRDRITGVYHSSPASPFWFQSLPRAIKHAKVTGKPILSLRLLGNLDEAYTCANSRFFRTILYIDPSIASWMKEKYVLHWKSVRPVPVITVDYGKGRKLKRTITGNSIHYILDNRGRIVDALPGLYGPKPFLTFLQTNYTTARKVSQLRTNARYLRWLRNHHRTKLQTTLQQWRKIHTTAPTQQNRIQHVAFAAPHPGTLAQLLELRLRWLAAPPLQPQSKPKPRRPNPSAIRAMPIAIAKSRVERPILQRMNPKRDKARLQKLRKIPNPSRQQQQLPQQRRNPPRPRPQGQRLRLLPPRRTRSFPKTMQRRIQALEKQVHWGKLQQEYRVGAQLSAPSLQRIHKEYQSPTAFGQPAKTSAKQHQQQLQKLIQQLHQNLALDSARNEFFNRTRLRHWLATSQTPPKLEAFNDHIYAILFLTPKSDLWLGMATPNSYTALPNAGMSTTSR